MMAALDLNSIAQISVARIAGCLAEGTLIAVLTAALLGVVRGLTAATRFAIWFSALITIASLALLGIAERSPGAVNSTAAIHAMLVLPPSWALYIFGAWVVIASILLARVGIGVVHVYRLRRSCMPLNPGSVDSGLREAVEQQENSRRLALCTSALVNVPTAIGFLRPAVVLPDWLIKEVSPEDLRQIVLHELAHLRRWDDWTNLMQQIVKALLFFHPAVWWIEKRASLEREMACDDAVVAETANPRAYAECLAHLAEKSMIRRGLALAQAAVGRVRQTSLRVARILRGDRPTAMRHGWMTAATVVTGLAVMCAIAVSRTPRLIAFEPDPPPLSVARLSEPSSALSGEDVAEAKVATIHAPPVNPTKADHKSHVETKLARSPARPETGQAASLRQSDWLQPAGWVPNSAEFVPLTPAVYIVVESGQYLPSGVVVWRSSVWRITLLSAADLNRRIPRKQT